MNEVEESVRYRSNEDYLALELKVLTKASQCVCTLKIAESFNDSETFLELLKTGEFGQMNFKFHLIKGYKERTDKKL